jgi:thioredoxin 1
MVTWFSAIIMHKASPYISTADHHDFQEKVVARSHAHSILVDFWAEWCPPCHALGPPLEAVVNERAGEVLLVKVEADEGENMKLAGHYHLKGFPTVLLFRNGQVIGRFSGARPKHWLEQFLNEHLRG